MVIINLRVYKGFYRENRLGCNFTPSVNIHGNIQSIILRPRLCDAVFIPYRIGDRHCKFGPFHIVAGIALTVRANPHF